MSVAISTAIMAHPERDWQKVKAQAPHAKVLVDTELRGVWWNAQRCWASFNPKAEYHIVLQDDVELCQNFWPAVAKMVVANSHLANSLTSFHFRWKRVEEALERGDHWLVFNKYVTAQALMLPTSIIPDLLNWCHRHIDPEFKHDDMRLLMWLAKTGRDHWVTAPSVIQHSGASDSTLGQSNPNKIARTYPGVEFDAMSIDWTLGVENPLRTGYPSPSWSDWKYYRE